MLFEVYSWSETKPVQFPPYLILLVRRLLEAGLVERRIQEEVVEFPGQMRVEPDLLIITEKGRRFVESLGIDETAE
jgi:hypothetical protein